MTIPTEEDFELELRSIPGVVNVGIGHGDSGEVNAVTLLARGREPESLRAICSHVTSLYYPDVPVIIGQAKEAVPTGPRGRVVLQKVVVDERQGLVEVELGYGGKIGTGRVAGGPLFGGAQATLAALKNLDYEVPFYLMTVNEVDIPAASSMVVTLRSPTMEGDRVGIAAWGIDQATAAARATLDALNRYLSMDVEVSQADGNAQTWGNPDR